MRKSMKKLVSFGLATALTLTTMFSGNLDFMGTAVTEEAQAAASTADVVVPEKPLEFKDLTADELITQMGTGWNLGNTMDGHTGLTPNETQWQFVETTKSMIKAVHDMGFNTVRIPTTWGTMINDDFSINEKWMSRVEDIVDYCMEQDMFAILNIHHDGADQSYWLNVANEGDDLDAMYTKFEGVWKTIATRFKNYDEHLIFESMNEIHSKDGWASSKADIDSDVAKINKLNQIFVDTVRATGSNNYDRWLLMPGWNTNIGAITDAESTFELPTDPNTEHQRLMVSVHDYDPWAVCGDTASSATTFNADSLSSNYVSNFKKMHDQFVAKGIPVVIGEYGIVDKGNTVDREFYCEGVNRLLQQNKLVGVYWDDGGTEGKPFSIFDRKAEKTKNKAVTDALMRGYFLTGADKGTDIVRDAEVTPITSFDVSQTEKLDMTVNDSLDVTVSNIAPSTNNDVILWKTENPNVATVYNGMIRARGIGTTKVIAFTQSGSFSKEITIGVVAETLAAGSECTEIKTDVTSVSIYEGEKQFLGVDAMAGDQAFGGAVTYTSSDESVATVSRVGKVVGVASGSAVITITASTGLTKEVPVEIKEVSYDGAKMKARMFVYFNDYVNSYWGTEISSDEVEIEGNGEYTLSLDCATDFSEAAAKKNVTSLKNIGALYIKDYEVHTGAIKKSLFKSGTIRYKSIKVNGTELNICDTRPYPAVKDSGIMDTNNPLNAYDGSVVSGKDITLKSDKFAINFKNIENPTKIEITFTLSDLVRIDGAAVPGDNDNSPIVTPGPDDEIGEPEEEPTTPPSEEPTVAPTTKPSAQPTVKPSAQPTVKPTAKVPVVKKGTKVKAGSQTYKVTNTSGSDKAVTYMAPKNKKVKSATVPATIKSNGVTYKVTAINSKAFAGCKKLTKITIGKNVTKIGANAFKGDSKLKKITVKSAKVKSVGKNAFKGINKKATIKVPKAKLKKYKKVFKGKGQAKSVKIKK